MIGAGVAGLAAARRLRTYGAHVIVIESGSVIGGRVCTLIEQGCQIELGAEFLSSFYTRTLALIDELGIRRDLHRIPSSSAILRDGRFYSLWPNVRIAFTQLVGSRHKLALSYLLASLLRHSPLLDLAAFQKASPIDDASVSDYARAHLSEDLLEYVLQPPLAGIFYWTPERTSRALLMLVLRAGLSHPTGLKLFTMRQGLGQLPHAMAVSLDVRLGTRACAVDRLPTGGYAVRLAGGGQPLVADSVICATTASVVPSLMPWLGAARLALFHGVRYSATALLSTGTRERLPCDYYGLLFPRRETAFLSSATIQAVKSISAVPCGRDTLALHMSGPAMNALRQCDDETLTRLMIAELRRLAPHYDPTPQAIFQRLFRCPEALPEFDVGHFRRLQSFASSDMEPPGLAFAGDYLGGPFVEGAILSGEAAAARVLRGRVSAP